MRCTGRRRTEAVLNCDSSRKRDQRKRLQTLVCSRFFFAPCDFCAPAATLAGRNSLSARIHLACCNTARCFGRTISTLPRPQAGRPPDTSANSAGGVRDVLPCHSLQESLTTESVFDKVARVGATATPQSDSIKARHTSVLESALWYRFSPNGEPNVAKTQQQRVAGEVEKSPNRSTQPTWGDYLKKIFPLSAGSI